MEEVKIQLTRDILYQQFLFDQYEFAYRDFVTKHPRIVPSEILREMVKKGQELETLHKKLLQVVS